MGKILLDTNAYSRLLVGDQEVYKVLNEADTVWMSVFVIGELMTGFNLGSRKRENLDILKRFLQKPTVATVEGTYQTAEIFADVKSRLKTTGTPIPINDVWIAAHAFETGSLLITYDQHFRSVPGLRIWDTK